MKEDFLHYVWQFKKFRFEDAETASGLPVVVNDGGSLNVYSGPDFFNARLKIGDQVWAGNVEVHINSSDWYAHGHETDPNYDNVILHVVWNHDADVYRKDNSVIPVLELKNRINEAAYQKYEDLLSRSPEKWINCEQDFPEIDEFHVKGWLERMYIERLEEKSQSVFQMLSRSSNNWEEVFFKLLCKNFGLNLNGEAFFNLAGSFPFSLILKLQDQTKLEALLFGQAGMLENEVEDAYYKHLQQEYRFLKLKYKLDNRGMIPMKYFRLRPDNFPTIRLAQLASLYANSKQLFSQLITARTAGELYSLLEIQVSPFWETHYNFTRGHAAKKKGLSRKFVDLLIINTLVPLRFTYQKSRGSEDKEDLLAIMSSLKIEENQIVSKFMKLKPQFFSAAAHSQALLHLKKNYCDKNRCLKCNLGTNLLQREKHFNTFGVCKEL